MATEAPHLGKLHPGPMLGVALYVLLAGALAVAVAGDRAGFLPASWHSAAPVAFGLFLALFALYRFVLVRAGRYPFGRAVFQIGAGLLFIGVLVSRSHATATASVASDLPALLSSSDPVVRRLACEVARYRPDGAQALEQVRAHASDPVQAVAAECAHSAQVLAR